MSKEVYRILNIHAVDNKLTLVGFAQAHLEQCGHNIQTRDEFYAFVETLPVS